MQNYTKSMDKKTTAASLMNCIFEKVTNSIAQKNLQQFNVFKATPYAYFVD